MVMVTDLETETPLVLESETVILSALVLEMETQLALELETEKLLAPELEMETVQEMALELVLDLPQDLLLLGSSDQESPKLLG
ncbi:hypothetical protein D3C87_1209520 [compost metagenome]